MCDEYDDERMKAFWRMLAEGEGLVTLNVVGSETEDPVLKPIGLEPAANRKPNSLAR
jgi:hypothetical protein